MSDEEDDVFQLDDDPHNATSAEGYLRSAFVIAAEGQPAAPCEVIRSALRSDQSLRRLLRLAGCAATDDPGDPSIVGAFAATPPSHPVNLAGFVAEMRSRGAQSSRPPASRRSHTDPALPPPRAPQDWSPSGRRRLRNTEQVLDYIEYCNSARQVRDSVARLYRPPPPGATATRRRRFLRKNHGRLSVAPSPPRRGGGDDPDPDPEDVPIQDLLPAAHRAIRRAAVAPGEDPSALPTLRQVLAQGAIRGRECTTQELGKVLDRLGLRAWLRPLVERLEEEPGAGVLQLQEFTDLDGPPKRNPGPRLHDEALRRQRRLEEAAKEHAAKELAKAREWEPALQQHRQKQLQASPPRKGKEFLDELGGRLCTDFVERVARPRTQREIRERLAQKPYSAEHRGWYEVLASLPAKELGKDVKAALAQSRSGWDKRRSGQGQIFPVPTWAPCARATSERITREKDLHAVADPQPKAGSERRRRFDPEKLPTHLTQSMKAKVHPPVSRTAGSPSRGWGGAWQKAELPAHEGWLHESAPSPRQKDRARR